MVWLPIETAPRTGDPIIYLCRPGLVSTCAWLNDADQPGWWDLRAEEPAEPRLWLPLRAAEDEADEPDPRLS